MEGMNDPCGQKQLCLHLLDSYSHTPLSPAEIAYTANPSPCAAPNTQAEVLVSNSLCAQPT